MIINRGVFTLRLTGEEHAQIKAGANAVGMSMNRFIIWATTSAAEAMKERQEREAEARRERQLAKGLIKDECGATVDKGFNDSGATPEDAEASGDTRG